MRDERRFPYHCPDTTVKPDHADHAGYVSKWGLEAGGWDWGLEPGTRHWGETFLSPSP
jgi:hypothetical protein